MSGFPIPTLLLYLEQCFSFSRVGVVHIFFPLQERVLIHDVHLVAVDERPQQHPLRKLFIVAEDLKRVDSCQLEWGAVVYVGLEHGLVLGQHFFFSLNQDLVWSQAGVAVRRQGRL